LRVRRKQPCSILEQVLHFDLAFLRKLRSYFLALITGIIGGAGFSVYFYGLDSHAIENGALIGVCISLTINLVEKAFLFEGLRRVRFSLALILRTIVQICIIVFYVVIGIIFYYSSIFEISLTAATKLPNFNKFIYGGELLAIIIYALTLSFLINMIRQMSRMLGQNVLLNMIIGKYSEPVEEERIFMFLDLDASTTHAERLGNIRYHELLDEYVYDITKPILDWKGEIYQYVGDEVVVTWKNPKGKTTMDCLECFFAISKTMENLASKYKAKYGFVPGFKAGFHYGTVVAGQIGDIKKEIVFQGDVVNTASRIKETCSSLGARILISRELLETLPQKETPFRALRAGSFLLKGKEHEVELYSVTKLN
jgi:adenylate cyclase